jgi:hypothetical protein
MMRLHFTTAKDRDVKELGKGPVHEPYTSRAALEAAVFLTHTFSNPKTCILEHPINVYRSHQ